MPHKSANSLRKRTAVRLLPAVFPAPMQVAAVCYRHAGDDLEFLLVANKQGRWTFPKGKVAPGLTPVAAVQREAREEAGTIGEVDPQPLDTYLHRKDRERWPEHQALRVVEAYLLEVRSQRAPAEWFRQPTWFDAVTAKTMLARRRQERFARELSRIIDAAIERLTESRLGRGA